MTLLAHYLAGRLVWRPTFRNGPRCHSKIPTNASNTIVSNTIVSNTIVSTHTMMTSPALASVPRGDAR